MRRRAQVFNRASTRPDAPPNRADWARIVTNAATPDVAEVWIFDEIGMWGITASDFVQQLKALKSKSIDVYLNSPGGEVYDGMAIHNALRNHAADVTVHVEGVAASIASVIAMGGDKVIMAPNATMMIHEGHMVAIGNSQDMRKAADLLDKVSAQIADVYAQRTGEPADTWRERMKSETWYNAKEAVKAGLADEVAQPRPRNSAAMPLSTWDLSIFNHAGRAAAPPPPLPAPVDAKPQAAATSTADVSMVSQAMGWFTAVDSIVDEAQEALAAYLGVPSPDPDEADDMTMPDMPGMAPAAQVDWSSIGDTIKAALSPPVDNPVDIDEFQVGMAAAAADAPAPPDTPPPVDFAALIADRSQTLVEAFSEGIITALGPLPPPDPDLFRAAMLLAANDAPTPPEPPAPVMPPPEASALPPPIDHISFVNALREAMQ